MGTIIRGTQICWGLKPEWLTLPITNLPPDTISVKRKMRGEKAVEAFVKTPDTVQRWTLAPDGDSGVKLLYFHGCNHRKDA